MDLWYWWLGALTAGHQYPQCWLRTHACPVVYRLIVCWTVVKKDKYVHVFGLSKGNNFVIVRSLPNIGFAVTRLKGTIYLMVLLLPLLRVWRLQSAVMVFDDVILRVQRVKCISESSCFGEHVMLECVLLNLTQWDLREFCISKPFLFTIESRYDSATIW